MIDTVSQIAVSTLGVLSLLLIARKNRWGFVAGLLSQPFWFVTAYMHGQWGIFLMSAIYTGTWLYGIYEWFYKKPVTAEGEMQDGGK